MGVMEVHGTDSARSTGHAFTALVAYPCLLEQSCRTTHVGHKAAQVVRVAQVTGACDPIRFRAPMGHQRSATTVRQTWLYMPMHGESQ